MDNSVLTKRKRKKTTIASNNSNKSVSKTKKTGSKELKIAEQIKATKPRPKTKVKIVKQVQPKIVYIDRFAGYIPLNTVKKDPNKPTFQDQMTKRDIMSKLKDYKRVAKNQICTLPSNTWLKYINKNTGKYRSGGFVKKTGPDWVMLGNPNTGFSWSANFKDNIFYRKSPIIIAREKVINKRKKQD